MALEILKFSSNVLHSQPSTKANLSTSMVNFIAELSSWEEEKSGKRMIDRSTANSTHDFEGD